MGCFISLTTSVRIKMQIYPQNINGYKNITKGFSALSQQILGRKVKNTTIFSFFSFLEGGNRGTKHTVLCNLNKKWFSKDLTHGHLFSIIRGSFGNGVSIP